MLFFRVFLSESSRTASKIRTNISTNSGKATKGLAGPIGTKFGTHVQIHMGMDIRLPLETQRGALGAFRGSTIQKSGEVRLAPTLVHVCGFIWEWTYRLNTSRPSIRQVAFRGGGGG